MSTIDEKLRQQLQEMKRGKVNCFPATVKAVDKSTNTITVVDGLDLEYDDVRLTAIHGGTDALICYPVKDTSCLVMIINSQENELVATHFEAVEEISVKVDQITVLVNKDGIKLNGEDYTMLKGAEVLAQATKLNNQVKALLQVLGGAPITEPGNGAPSALQVALNAAVSALQDADFTNLENDKVKHG